MNELLIKKIKETASKKAKIDREDFEPDDCAAGNIDDAYYGGSEDGEILFARELLSLIED